MLLYSTGDTELMSHPLGAKVGKYKHRILIAVTVAALGAYFLPLSTVFAGHNGNSASGANQAARDAIKAGHSTTPKTKSNSGTSDPSSGSSSPSKSTSPKTSDPPVDNSPQVGTNIG